MANVLLVTPSNVIRAELQNWSSPHLGVWRIAGWLERYGHSTWVWDTILDEKPFARRPLGGWHVMGFSLTHDTLPDDLDLIERMKKKHPNTKIVVGGVEASTNYQQVFEECPAVDAAIIGEGETGMLDFLEEGSTSHRLPARGAIERTFNPFTLDEFTQWNMEIPFQKMRHREHWAITKALRPQVKEEELHCVRLNTSTFCNRSCPFCSVTHIHKMACGRVIKPITMTGEDTKELVRKVKKALPEVRSIYFNDDDFCLNQDKAIDFFDDPPPLQYHIQARVDTVDEQLLHHMAKGGCVRISYGVEHVTNRVLKALGKGITIEQADEAIALTREAGIEPIVLLMLFPPTAMMEDMKVLYQKMKAWEEQKILISAVSYIRAYHGTSYLNKRFHDIQWERIGSIKRPRAVLPDDPDVRTMWFEFEKRLAQEEAKLTDHWKGRVSSLMIKVLGECLKERGVI